jgi:hypothetical protein
MLLPGRLKRDKVCRWSTVMSMILTVCRLRLVYIPGVLVLNKIVWKEKKIYKKYFKDIKKILWYSCRICLCFKLSVIVRIKKLKKYEMKKVTLS